MNKIDIFYHIACIGNYKEIVKEQIDLLKSSVLYEKTDYIYVTILGEYDGELDYIFDNKIRLKYISKNLELYENITMNLIREHCENLKYIGKEKYIVYMHTKGVSRFNLDPEHVYDWRKYMEYFNIEKWQDCYDKLNEGFDICGVDWIEHPIPHFSGTFWWAKSSYIQTLPYLEINSDRNEAEYWIGKTSNNAAIYSFCDLKINGKKERILRDKYERNQNNNM